MAKIPPRKLLPGDAERQAGFYWVNLGNNRWEPAEWQSPNWFTIGGLRGFGTDEFDEIGPRIERNS